MRAYKRRENAFKRDNFAGMIRRRTRWNVFRNSGWESFHDVGYSARYFLDSTTLHLLLVLGSLPDDQV